MQSRNPGLVLSRCAALTCRSHSASSPQASASAVSFCRRAAAFSCRAAANFASPALSRNGFPPSAPLMSRTATAAVVLGRGAGGASFAAGRQRDAREAWNTTARCAVNERAS